MRNLRFRLPAFSALSVCTWTLSVLAVVYIGLIAVAMSYATLTVSFFQSMKNDEAEVATLESAYLAQIADIQSLDYHAIGYVTPSARVFVPTQRVTALR
jgi:Tfp pilus assembly protein PilO